MSAGKTIVVWVGLTRHHMDSARGLPQETELIINKIRSGFCPMTGDLLLEPIGKPMIGFGVVLDRFETPLTRHQVRTRTDLAKHYAAEIRTVREAFRLLGFTRAAQLFTSTDDEEHGPHD
jgi:hypothetical protein